MGFRLEMPTTSLPRTWPWHFPVVKEIWPSSLPQFPYLTLREGSEPTYLLLAGSGCSVAKPCSCCFCSDHLRVIKWTLLPRAEWTGSKIIFSWNILLNWNALAVKKTTAHTWTNQSVFPEMSSCSPPGTWKGNQQTQESGWNRPRWDHYIIIKYRVKDGRKSRAILIDL